jgi:HlyD family secretion protein
MRSRGLTFGILLVVASAGLYFYSQSGNAPPRYELARVERGPLTSFVSGTGSLMAVSTVLVGSQVSGQIQKIYVDFNSAVKKGDIIAQLDSESFEAKVKQAKAQIEAARASVENAGALVNRLRADLASARIKLAASHAQTARARISDAEAKRDLARRIELFRRGLISRAEMDTGQTSHELAVAQLEQAHAESLAQAEAITAAEAQLQAAEAQSRMTAAQVVEREALLRQAEVDLQRTTIVAPVDGIVVSRAVDVGQTVVASLQTPTLVSIAEDLAMMHVDMSAHEADVGRISRGQRVTFTVDAFPGQTYTGTVVQIRSTPVVFQHVVTYSVVISAKNPGLKLLPGMTANVRVITDERKSALKIPNAALRFRPRGEVPPSSSALAKPDAGQDGVAAPTGRGRFGGRVWTRGPDGKPTAILVKLGITDGTYTEVLEGDLREAQEVIVRLAEESEPAKRRPRLRL